jgi:NFU1 iron-sulfur cluster scaffold homolog, mitochondrial
MTTESVLPLTVVLKHLYTGSCPSSTVTMKMGIERVLKENFPNVEVVQVEEESDKPTELTYEAIEEEIKRIRPAITAMGGMIEIILVDPIGEVTLSFRGANKVRQGLEMALLDVPFCKHIKFVSS